MKKLVAGTLVAFLTFALLASMYQSGQGQGNKKKGPMLAHNVYFSLKDKSPKAKQKLVNACKKYLKGHPGEVFFAAGVLAEDLRREVNDLDFDVALHIVFENNDYQEQYQKAKRHLQFIDQEKDNWSKVRVFDSLVQR